MRKVFATQAVFAAIAAVGMNGCGKSVDKDGAALAQFQAGSPVSTQGGCDIVGVPQAQEIRAFSEISQPQGTYDLVSFAAVSMKRAYSGNSMAEGIAAVKGEVVNGLIDVNPACSDLSQMPNETVMMAITAPRAISAVNGSIAMNFTAQATVYGPNVVDASGMPRVSPQPTAPVANASECQTVDESLAGAQYCSGSTRYFNLGNGSIGVLHVVESNVNGAIVMNKVYATYAIEGGRAPTDPNSGGNNGNNYPGQKPGKTKSKKDNSKSNGNNKSNGKSNNGANNGNNGKVPGGKTPGRNGKGPAQYPNQYPGKYPNQSPNQYPNSSNGPVVVYGGPNLPGTVGGTQPNSNASNSNGEKIVDYKLKVKAKTSADGEQSKLKVKEKKTTVSQDGTVTESKVKLKDKEGPNSEKTKLKAKKTSVSPNGTVVETKVKVKDKENASEDKTKIKVKAKVKKPSDV